MTTDKADSVHGSRRVEGSLRGCLVNLTSHELAVNSVSITEYARGRVQKSYLPNCCIALSALHGNSRVM